MNAYDVEYVPVADLVPYEKNAKKHPREQIDRIAESIRQFGFRQNLVVDRNNVVVIGHGRLLAARQLGLQRVPCVRVEDLSDEQIKALRLADNRVAESDWDEDLLRIELDDLPDAGLTIRQQLIWVKSQATIGRQDFQHQYESVLTGDNFLDEEMESNGYEPCLYGWKDGKGHVWYKKRKEKDVLFFDKPRASAEHPTMKPILLFDYEMQCNTKKGDAVLDLFAGSGTTIMAAEQNGRVAYCMELDPRFVDVIIERWEAFTGEKAVLLKGGVSDGEDGTTADSD